jgi:hypothetical protein
MPHVTLSAAKDLYRFGMKKRDPSVAPLAQDDKSGEIQPPPDGSAATRNRLPKQF